MAKPQWFSKNKHDVGCGSLKSPANEEWPYRASNELALVLVRKRREPTNFYYIACNIRPHNWSSSLAIDKCESFSKALVPSRANSVVAIVVGSLNSFNSFSTRHNIDVKALIENL